MLTLNDIFSKSNLNGSLKYLKTKPDTCGSDGMYLSDFEDYWKKNQNQIIEVILSGKYNFGPAVQHDILQKNGKTGRIAIFSVCDRLLLHTAADKLNAVLDKCFSKSSFAFRKGKGVMKAVEQAAKYIEEGNKYVVFADIKNYFDEIDHN